MEAGATAPTPDRRRALRPARARAAGVDAGGDDGTDPGAGGTAGLVALDVALLLPPAAAAAVGRLNARLQPPPAGFAFDETHLPHVTLVQQFGREADMPVVLALIDQVASETPPIVLRGGGLQRGRTTTSLTVDGGAALRRLHDRLLMVLEPHAAPPGGAAAFVGGDEPARDGDVDWVARFRVLAAGPRYEPHVTLGVGALGDLRPSVAFTATGLALCQLGRFCTCRRVLGSWTLDEAGRAGAAEAGP